MRRGLFITLEGMDGSGKTTQLNLLTEWLKANGHKPFVTRQPGGTALGEKLRALALDSKTTAIAPLAELALMFADRAQSIAEIIAPALSEGRVIVCDRYTDSTEAYQGGGRNLGSEIVLDLHRTLCGNLQPDLTILLLPSFDRALGRARLRNAASIANEQADEDRFEREQDDFHRRVWQKYKEIAEREQERVFTVEGDAGIEEVHARIRSKVEALLARTK